MILFFSYLGDSVGGFVLSGDSYRFAQNVFGASAAITVVVLFRFVLKKLTKIRRGEN